MLHLFRGISNYDGTLQSANNLSYNYDGNQVLSITDTEEALLFYGSEAFRDNHKDSDDFTYNANGYVNKDLNKGIKNITYNYLNLPEKITFGGGNTLTYVYDALGVKRRMIIGTNLDDQYSPLSQTTESEESEFDYELSPIDYLNNYVYRDNVLERILLPNGHIYHQGNRYDYNYYIKDHLGSIRVMSDEYYNDKCNHYYPFGSMFGISCENDHPYKYNGKEQQKDHRLNWYDYGARMYSATEGIWKGPDPLAEKDYSVSPYAYCLNNPVKYVDPTGMIVEDPDEIYKKHKDQMNSQFGSIQKALKAEGLSEGMKKALEQLEDSYKSVLKEYSTLEKSDQVYRVFNSGGKGGGVYFDKGDIMIGIGDASLGLVGHELKHAYQYEKGEISFRLDGKGFGSLYDISDETAAYNRERMLSSGVLFFTNPARNKWGNSDVRSFGRTMLPPAYEGLPEGPININSKIGKELRNNTINSGTLRLSPSDAYKGYDNDFNKGWGIRK